jgi:hypothetical protein
MRPVVLYCQPSPSAKKTILQVLEMDEINALAEAYSVLKTLEAFI